MNKITNLEQANLALSTYLPKGSKLTKEKVNLDRMIPLMKLLGNPEKKLRIIHIAGTSGKTSTAYFLSALLCKSNLKIGLTVSPYVDQINERIQINSQPLDEEKFCYELTIFLNIIQKLIIKPSYFELISAFSYWLFEKEKVDYAVIETGLGGLLDATNIAQEPNKLCLITDIGYDHMQILGDTIQKIANQKAGIIHKNNPVIMYKQTDNITNIFKNKALSRNSDIILVNEGQIKEAFKALANNNLPDFQKRNWFLAYQAFLCLQKRDNLRVINNIRLEETQNILIPARMEEIIRGNKIIIMDGAHNQQKMSAFINSFKKKYPEIKPAVLIALKHDKDFEKILPLFNNFAARIITTNFNTSQDLLFKSIPASKLANDFKNIGTENVMAIPTHDEALASLLNGPDKICIITGSFYLISQLRKARNIKYNFIIKE